MSNISYFHIARDRHVRLVIASYSRIWLSIDIRKNYCCCREGKRVTQRKNRSKAVCMSEHEIDMRVVSRQSQTCLQIRMLQIRDGFQLWGDECFAERTRVSAYKGQVRDYQIMSADCVVDVERCLCIEDDMRGVQSTTARMQV